VLQLTNNMKKKKNVQKGFNRNRKVSQSMYVST